MSVFNRLFGRDKPQSQQLDPDKLFRAFSRFFNSRGWGEARHIIKKNPVLLHPDADDLLNQMAAAETDPGKQKMVRKHQAVLRRCRDVGIEQAIAEITGDVLRQDPSPIGDNNEIQVPPQFRSDIQQAEKDDDRFMRTDDRSALDSALAAWQRIISHRSFSSSDLRFQSAVRNDTAIVYARRYGVHGRLDDLDRALELWQSVVDAMPEDSPDLPQRLNNLGAGLIDRYERIGDVTDLAKAIRVLQTAIGRMSSDSPDLPSLLSNLGNGLRIRYRCSGDIDDLEHSIRVTQSAVERTPFDSPDLPGYLINLGNILGDRYEHAGQLADLQEVIRITQSALQRLPPESPYLSNYLANLAVCRREMAEAGCRW
jgi:tetratricopeptide (TPR) repeat protein